MVLTEEEKKEYLINYQPTPQFLSVAELVLLLASGFCGAVVLTGLNYLGYTHIDLSNMQKILFSGIDLPHFEQYIHLLL